MELNILNESQNPDLDTSHQYTNVIQVSLVVHPDRVQDGDRELATRKFQCIGAVYAILSDDNK